MIRAANMGELGGPHERAGRRPFDRLRSLTRRGRAVRLGRPVGLLEPEVRFNGHTMARSHSVSDDEQHGAERIAWGVTAA